MASILQAPNPILNTVCSDVDVTKPSTLILSMVMTQAMLDANGVGLAAPQVGEIVRMFCMRYGGSTKKAKMRGMDARCVQHEIDHLNGVLITDKQTGETK